MSLLRFIRRDRDERKTTAESSVATATSEVAALSPRIEMPAPAPAAPSKSSALDLDRIRQELEEIARIIGSDESASDTAVSGETTVDIKLGEIIRIAPQAFKQPDLLRSAADTTLSVPVPKLFEQLTKGKVSTKLSYLVADIPADHLSDYAAEHGNESIVLPLALVVAAVQPGELRKRTSAKERDLSVSKLPNLFTPGSLAASAAAPAPEPPFEAPAQAPVDVGGDVVHEITEDVEPAAVEAETESIQEAAPAAPDVFDIAPEAPAESDVPGVFEIPAEPETEPALAAELPPPAETEPLPEPVVETTSAVEPPQTYVVEPMVEFAPAESAPAAESVVASVEPLPEPPAAEPAEESGYRLLLNGLDINSATAEELALRLDGLGVRLARKMVEVRQTQGPFTDLYDLARVPGLRSKRFEQVTGLAWEAAYFKHRDAIREIVGAEDGRIPDVRQITARFSQLPGFAGCMIIHEDGLVLSQSWNHPAAEALGAFAPQMFKKINKYVKPLKLGEMKSVCFFVGHQPITVVRSGPVYFAALHQPDKLSKKQVTLAQGLAMELGRRLARAV